MEPHAATAWIEPDGILTVSTSTQGTFYVRKQLARIFGRPISKVRVQGTPAGWLVRLQDPHRRPAGRRGGAGPSPSGPAASSTVARTWPRPTRRPARSSRSESAPTRTGRLTGLDARLVFDSGAYIEWSIEGIAAVLIGGPYRWGAFDVRAYGVRTNRFGTGSYRGPGGPQAAFAIESLIDELAGKLELDPIELRLRNLAAEGDPMVDGEPWPRLGHRQVLEAAAAHPLWRGRADLPPDEGVGRGARASGPGARRPRPRSVPARCRRER